MHIRARLVAPGAEQAEALMSKALKAVQDGDLAHAAAGQLQINTRAASII